MSRTTPTSAHTPAVSPTHSEKELHDSLDHQETKPLNLTKTSSPIRSRSPEQERVKTPMPQRKETTSPARGGETPEDIFALAQKRFSSLKENQERLSATIAALNNELSQSHGNTAELKKTLSEKHEELGRAENSLKTAGEDLTTAREALDAEKASHKTTRESHEQVAKDLVSAKARIAAYEQAETKRAAEAKAAAEAAKVKPRKFCGF